MSKVETNSVFGNPNQVNGSQGEDDNIIIHLTYVKVPQTLEVRKRQYEEQLREKYNIPKEKTGKLL